MKKGLVVLFIAGALAVTTFMPLSATAMVDGIERLIPAETQVADTSGEKFVATPSTNYMDVAESQKVETTGPGFLAMQTKYYMDVAESQEVDTTKDSPRAVVDKPAGSLKKCPSC